VTANSVAILLIDDDEDFAQLIQGYLQGDKDCTYDITWKRTGADALFHIGGGGSVDIVLMEYFLPDINGRELARSLLERKKDLPVVVITTNTDFDLALEIRKYGIAEYLVKEDFSPSVLTTTIKGILRRKQLNEELMNIEISKHRLSAMQKTIDDFLARIGGPMSELEEALTRLNAVPGGGEQQRFITIINENIDRIKRRIDQLRNLDQDKPIPYIGKIRMIDISNK
jgi:DNA-binding response OmpR family regulator